LVQYMILTALIQPSWFYYFFNCSHSWAHAQGFSQEVYRAAKAVVSWNEEVNCSDLAVWRVFESPAPEKGLGLCTHVCLFSSFEEGMYFGQVMNAQRHLPRKISSQPDDHCTQRNSQGWKDFFLIIKPGRWSIQGLDCLD